jgi:tRNA(Ile)-lysidine synthase
MAGPHPAVAAVRSAVRRGVADLQPGARLLVACSGGPDSLALAAATAFVSERGGLVASGVVVDHGLHEESSTVTAEAAAACRALGLEAEVVPVSVVASGRGPEAEARVVRYEALTRAGERAGAAAVLLGHTRDDQAEQVLLGLARGSGARSLAGMPPRRGVFRRPLLAVDRATTEAACRALGLTPWEDPANVDPAFTRSRIRRRVLPVLEAELGPGVADALARTADQLRQDADVLEALADELLARARGDGDELRVDVLAGAAPALRTRALRSWLVSHGSPPGLLTREHVTRCEDLVTDWHGQGAVHLPGRVVVRRRYGTLSLARGA